MQDQRSTVQFFPETLENNAATDRQQSFWNNSTNNSTQALNVSEYFQARSNANMSYGHRGFRLDDGYGRWNSSEPPLINVNSYGGSEVADNGWMAPSTAYGHPFLTDSIATGAQRVSTSGSSSYSGAFVEDGAGYPSDDSDGCRFLDDRRHSSKRRSLEGPSGQSSGSSGGLNIAGSTEPDSEYPSFNNVAGNLEAFQGDFNTGHQFDGASSQLWSPGNSMHSYAWPSHHHSSSSMNPFVRVMPSMSSQQPLLPTIPAVPQIGYPMPWNGSSNSRIGSSTDIHLTSRRETNTRGIERSSIPEHPAFAPTMEMRRMGNGNMISPGDAGGHFSFLQPFSGVLPPLAPSWMPHQGLTGHASSSSAAVSRPGVDLHTAHQQLRSAFLMGRRINAMGAPATLRSRHARNMMIFEQIRNALELMQREDSMMIDDVAVMDESEYLDNYRDWRLDVDNMSYEVICSNLELLALEERIGNVSTGLDEGTVLKKMKRRKYLSFVACKPESCCICQEDYMNGEDLGVLSCGHDFHASCVGKWLIQKNICPICKITALST